MFNHLFCSQIFCKGELVEFLLKNYIVWPCDITSDANKTRLRKWWCYTFPDLKLPDLQIEHFPMLIGIMLRARREEPNCLQSEYQCQVLQRCDLLLQTNTKSTLEDLLQTLRTFRAEWHRQQQFLVPFDVVRSTGLCPDVLAEISKYLSFDEMIRAFSVNILPALRRARAKVNLVTPSNSLLQMVCRHLDPTQIASLRITDNFQIPRRYLPSFLTFTQLTSVTAVSKRGTHAIDYLRRYLPNLRRLALWFNDETEWHLFRGLRDLSSPPITHLQIHCPGNHFISLRNEYQAQKHYAKNTTITSFMFDTEYYPVHRGGFHRHNHSSQLVNSALDFIGSLTNVRRVRFVTNRSKIQTFLQLNEWQWLIGDCACLERVIIQLVDGGDFTREAKNIEQELCHLRPTIVFRIKSA